MKISSHEENTAFLNVYVPNKRVSKCMEQNVTS